MKRTLWRRLGPRRAVAFVLGSIAVASLALASGASAQQTAEVEFLADEVAVYADTVDHFEAMSVRIADPDDNVVLDVRSHGDPVAWSPSAGDPDGLYRYEVIVVTTDPSAAGEEEDEGERLSRQNGSFQIRGGVIVEPDERESSLWDRALRFAGVVLDAIRGSVISSAQAQDLTVSAINCPTVRYNDTDVTAQLFEWITRGCAGSTGSSPAQFDIFDTINDNAVFLLDESFFSARSLVVDGDGNLGLADNAVFIERSTGRVGIGIATPQTRLHIAPFAEPPLFLLDDSGTTPQTWAVRNLPGHFDIRGEAFLAPFEIEDGAGSDTLVVDDLSRVGIGTSAPRSTLEVTNSDGTTQILVAETSATVDNRTLLQLTNNGRPQILLSNIDSDFNWATGMGNNDAYVIANVDSEYRFAKGGRVRWFGPGVEDPIFDFNNRGNLAIAGTLTENSDVNAKRDVVPVDGAALLARVATLPVSTWTYKADETGTRHLGPMAQDFHAAFGLGVDDRHLAPRDLAGVALAAVKELQAVVRENQAALRQSARMLRRTDAPIAALQMQQSTLRQRIEALEAEFTR